MEEIEQLAKELDFLIEGETTLKVIEDFFVCNPASSILERIGKLGKSLGLIRETGSSRPSSSSPEGTSSEETQFSGDIPPQSASPT
jgi:hypothetical protein